MHYILLQKELSQLLLGDEVHSPFFINIILQQPYFKSSEYDTDPPGSAGNRSWWIYSMVVCFFSINN